MDLCMYMCRALLIFWLVLLAVVGLYFHNLIIYLFVECIASWSRLKLTWVLAR